MICLRCDSDARLEVPQTLESRSALPLVKGRIHQLVGAAALRLRGDQQGTVGLDVIHLERQASFLALGFDRLEQVALLVG